MYFNDKGIYKDKNILFFNVGLSLGTALAVRGTLDQRQEVDWIDGILEFQRVLGLRRKIGNQKFFGLDI